MAIKKELVDIMARENVRRFLKTWDSLLRELREPERGSLIRLLVIVHNTRCAESERLRVESE